MKPSTLLIIAINYLGLTSAAAVVNPDEALTVANLEKRKCFESGAQWSSARDEAVAAAKKHCNAGLKGKYLKRETRVKCSNLPGNKHVKFTVGLTGSNAPDSRNLGYAECLDGLSSEIYNCKRGGDTTYGRWRFRADPNEGKC
ncbi:hypothetical protein V8F20_004989 [Naviculisporaceae sp. PSN 640]